MFICATCNDAAELPAALKTAGRLDHAVSLSALGGDDRAQLLQAAFDACLASTPLEILQVCILGWFCLLEASLMAVQPIALQAIS